MIELYKVIHWLLVLDPPRVPSGTVNRGARIIDGIPLLLVGVMIICIIETCRHIDRRSSFYGGNYFMGDLSISHSGTCGSILGHVVWFIASRLIPPCVLVSAMALLWDFPIALSRWHRWGMIVRLSVSLANH